MNWDWDKLQEKRHRQSGQQPPRNNKNDDDDPFGSGGRRGPGGGGPGFGQFGDMLKQFRQSKFPALKILLGVAILGWLASGIYIVGPEEMGVVLRFGAHVDTVPPGPHYHWPYPIEEVLKPKVHRVQRVEIGFRTLRSGREGTTTQSRPVLEEAAMLTADENIVNMQFIVQYQIKNPSDFLFKVDLQIPRNTGQEIYSDSVKNAAEAVMREVIGSLAIDAALTEEKTLIQNTTKEKLQEVLDKYEAGVLIQAVQLQDVQPPQEVSDAFKDVASAREDRSRFENKALAYKNELLPRTRGEIAEIGKQAEAYKVTVIQRAQGESARFLALMHEYNKAKDVTKKRLYLDAMEEVLSAPGMEKVIVGSKNTAPALPFLNLDRKPGQAQSGSK